MVYSFRSFGSQIIRPLKLFTFAVLNKLNSLFRTGNMRFAFERMYLTKSDPWNYQYSPYERDKYERTLSCAIAWRKASASALEIGCSVGIFTEMLAGNFDDVTAVDVSQEALRTAIVHSRNSNNIEFIRSDLRNLALGRKYDVIFCAEIFYYMRAGDAQLVCQRLTEHLSANGVIVFVAGTAGHNPSPVCWRAQLAIAFEQVSIQIVDHPVRPYEIAVFVKPVNAEPRISAAAVPRGATPAPDSRAALGRVFLSDHATIWMALRSSHSRSWKTACETARM